MIVDNPHLAKPEVHSLDLTVETTGMTLTVNGGSFTMNSQNYLLDDDFNHEFPVTDYDRFVIGFLGKDKTSGDIVVLVQDIVEGSDSLGFNSADFIQFTKPPGMNELPDPLALNIYPNPTNGSFSVSYFLSSGSNIEIDITDISGRNTHTIIKQFQRSGVHFHKISGLDLKQGIYVVKIKSGDQVSLQKLVIN